MPSKAAAAKALRDEWYDRLAADGFVDLESRRDPNGPLNGYSGGAPRPGTVEGKADYYDAARAAVNDPALPWTGREKKVIALHVDGLPYREIRRRVGCRRSMVETTVAAFARWLARPRRGGRPNRLGLGRGTWTLIARLSDDETDALYWLAAQLQCTPAQAARAAIRQVVKEARGVNVHAQPGAPAAVIREVAEADGVART